MDRAILTPPFAHSGGDLRIAESAPGIPTARGTDGGRASRPPAGRRGPAYRRPSGHTAPSPRPRPTTVNGHRKSPAHTEKGHSSFYADFFVTRGVRAARNGNGPAVRGGGAAGRALGSCSSTGCAGVVGARTQKSERPTPRKGAKSRPHVDTQFIFSRAHPERTSLSRTGAATRVRSVYLYGLHSTSSVPRSEAELRRAASEPGVAISTARREAGA